MNRARIALSQIADWFFVRYKPNDLEQIILDLFSPLTQAEQEAKLHDLRIKL